MTITLEFLGKDTIRRDPMKFLEALRARYPNTSETGIQEIAKAELGKTAPRYPQYVQILFGRDILSADLTTMPAWKWLPPGDQRILLSADNDRKERMVDPAGMEATYVWRATNDWLQDVADADAELIRRSGARSWFWDHERRGPFTPRRMWDFPVKTRESFDNMFDADAYRKDLQRRQQWSGI